MLFLLTGEIQTGKTRWLEARLGELEAAGVEVRGVLAPGVWEPQPDGGFWKTGIDLVFYPEHGRVRFAERLYPNKVAEDDEGGYGDDFCNIPEKPVPQLLSADGRPLGWLFYPYWFGQVNEAFAELRRDREPVVGAKRLVVMDEIGRLELAGKGFSEALAFLQDGESPAWPNAVALVRSDLLERVRTLLEPAWGEHLSVIHPDDWGRIALRAAFSL